MRLRLSLNGAPLSPAHASLASPPQTASTGPTAPASPRRRHGPVLLAAAGLAVALSAVSLLAVAISPVAILAGDRGSTGSSAGLAPRDPRADARAIVALADPVAMSAVLGDRAAARSRWRELSDRWFEVEDPIKAADRRAYERIETAMQDVAAALPAEGDWTPSEVPGDVAALEAECLALAASSPGAAASRPGEASPASVVTVAAFHDEVARARLAPTVASVDRLRELWLSVEPLVAARSKEAYAASEEALAQARSALAKGDAAAGARALERLDAATLPLARSTAPYGALDAAAILLREGAEALLVLAALVAYLGKLGAADRTRLVWLGGLAGTVASLVLGLGLARLFQGIAGGVRRELLEGVSSLVAAGLLVVVGQWLHGKVRRGGWKRDVALAVQEGRGLSLAAVAFLAVFREGGETVLFYAGMAPSIETRSLVLGIAIGLGLLAALAWVVLGLGRRLPLGPFFAFATALLWALAIKFVGGGVHSLQAAGLVSATPLACVPSAELLGLSPTVETCLAQLGGVLAWVGVSLGPSLVRRTRAS